MYFCPMKKLITLSLSALFLLSCNNSAETLMSEKQLGALQSTDSIERVADLFGSDSIAYERLGTGEIVGLSVFNSVQKKRFQLKANIDQHIEIVQVFDSIFQTQKGIGVGKTVGDLKKVYTIDQVLSSFKSISIYVKESPLLFLFDRSELPENIKYGFDPIDAVQLPSEAVINQVIISW
jgi:hypothetical protein